jgi:hypothetical protein
MARDRAGPRAVKSASRAAWGPSASSSFASGEERPLVIKTGATRNFTRRGLSGRASRRVPPRTEGNTATRQVPGRVGTGRFPATRAYLGPPTDRPGPARRQAGAGRKSIEGRKRPGAHALRRRAVREYGMIRRYALGIIGHAWREAGPGHPGDRRLDKLSAMEEHAAAAGPGSSRLLPVRHMYPISEVASRRPDFRSHMCVNAMQ